MDQARLEQAAFELVGYMVTSGRNLLDETPLYGPFRLVDAASRLITILEEEGVASGRLATIQKEIDKGKYSVMNNKQEFTSFLDSIVDVLVDYASLKKEGVIVQNNVSVVHEDI